MTDTAARLDAFDIFEDGKKLDTVFYSAAVLRRRSPESLDRA
jgi:hypothetical protein